MRDRQIPYIAGGVMLSAFVLLAGWELLFEDIFDTKTGVEYGKESLDRHLTEILLGALLMGMALIAPLAAALRSGARRQRAERAIAEKSALLETTFESMSQGVTVYDAGLKLTAFNQRYLELSSSPPGFIRLGMPFEEVVRFRAERGDYGPGDVETQVRRSMRAARHGKTQRDELTTPDGAMLALWRNPLPDGGFVTTFTDITERKAVERAIARQSALLDTTFENMSQGIVVYDKDFRVTAFNRNFVDLSDYPPDFIRLGMPLEEIVRFRAPRGDYGPTEDAEAMVRERVEARRRGETIRREHTLPDGRVIAVVRDHMPDGGYVTTLTDITERKKAEQEIAEKSAVLETTFESMSQGITVYDANHGLIAFNSRFVELFDFPPGFLCAGRTFEDIAHFLAERGEFGPGDVEELVHKRVVARDRGDINPRERTRPDGTVISARRDTMPGGGYVTTYTDITERERAEAALRESQRRFAGIVELADDAIISIDDGRRITLFNEGAERTFGYEAKEVLGQPLDVLLPSKVRKKHRRHVNSFAENPDISRVMGERRDLLGRRKDGTEFPAEVSISKLESGGRHVFTAILRDVTERKRAAAALRESEELFARVFHASPGMFTISRPGDGAHHEVSENWIATMGYSRDEAMTKTAVELGIWADLGERTRFVERLKKEGSIRDFEAKFRTKSGAELDVLVAGEFLEFGGEPHLIIVSHDITERKRSEEALRTREARLRGLQTELLNVSRQSAMGQLSSALAHELNQPLAAIMNYVQASRRMIKKDGGTVSEKAYRMMDNALDQADRAGAIMRGLRDIVEKGEAARAESDINKVVEEASALGLIGAARNGILVDLDFGADLPPVIINEIQIQQVVMNLVRNGVEAMTASKKRDLTIKTALDHEDAVEIAIGDSGPGLVEKVEKRLFEPFVSTKAGGMGIGLSISHSIVEAHGGRLWATPNPDGGTVFHFTLPLAPDGAQENDE